MRPKKEFDIEGMWSEHSEGDKTPRLGDMTLYHHFRADSY